MGKLIVDDVIVQRWLERGIYTSSFAINGLGIVFTLIIYLILA